MILHFYGDAEDWPHHNGYAAANVVSAAPIAITVGTHESLRGHVQLPPGFAPRQATIRLLDKPGGRQLGMRVLPVT